MTEDQHERFRRDCERLLRAMQRQLVGETVMMAQGDPVLEKIAQHLSLQRSMTLDEALGQSSDGSATV